MSESNRTLENSSLELFEKSKGEKSDFHISNKIDLSSNPSDLNNRTDMTGSRTDVNSYNRDSRGEKSEEHNQMIDLPKLLRQLSLARVVLKRLPISTEATKLRITDDLTPVDVGIVDQDIDANAPGNKHVPPSEYIGDDEQSHADSIAIEDTCDIVDDAKQKYGSTATYNSKKPADLIKRNCPNCKIIVTDASVCKKQSCAKCEALLSYQCARCDKPYKYYTSLIDHLKIKCNAHNLDLKCTKCDYQTHAKRLMYLHKTYCLSRTIHSCSDCEFKTRNISNLHVHKRLKHKDESSVTCDSKKPAGLIKRSCPECKTDVADAKIKSNQLCTQCDTPLSYQCARCDKQYNNYNGLASHLYTICNAQNLDLKCPKCNYQTHSKRLMYMHKTYCLSRTIYSCSHCEYTTRLKTNLHRHLTTTHKDILKVDCSQCETKPNKCEQCKNKVPICETCHRGFSSTDRFQEHQKSCKPTVLECEYCPYQTIDNSKLKKHIKLEHLSGSISRALSVKESKVADT